MTYQAELQPTINGSGEDSALRPTSVMGRGGDAVPLIHNMIDDYLDASRILKGIDEDEDPTRYTHLDEYLSRRRTEIAEYVHLSIDNDALPVDSRLSRKVSGDLGLYSRLYTEREIRSLRTERTKAMAASVIKQALNGSMFSRKPGHITIENEADPNSELTIAFTDVVKGGLKASAKAIRKIREAAVIHSEEITIPSSETRFVDEDLLDDPIHSEEITLAVNVHKVTPEQVLAMK